METSVNLFSVWINKRIRVCVFINTMLFLYEVGTGKVPDGRS